MSEETNPKEPSLVGTVLAGRYRVERLLGSGGMGAVYLAEHVLMKKAVAVKVLHGEMTAHPEIVARFEREAVAAARIDHPNVAAAMDFGRLEDGSFYLVLEYVGGQSLRQLVDQGPLDLARALAIAHQIAEGLTAAHAAGIVHRDLKPDNVMLVLQPDGREAVKVLDFGIAKVSGAGELAPSGRNLTRFGTVMGTAGYMAPEQALGLTVDERADLYSVGVVLYEMIVGAKPFDAEEPAQILAKQLTEPVPAFPVEVPPDLSALVTRLLANKQDERVATAAELSAEIARLRAGLAGAESGPASSVIASARTVPLATAPTTFEQRSVITTPGLGRSRRSTTAIAAGAALVAVIGAGVAFRARTVAGTPGVSAGSPSAAPSTNVAALAAPTNSTALPEVASGSPPPSASVAPSATSVTTTATTETRSKRADGRTVTTRTTRRSTVSEERSEQHTKRRTGPGGIYIPPPSQWFK